MRTWLATSRIRPLALTALERANPGDIHVWHPHYPRKVLLHSFHHKGYWFYGKRHDAETGQFYARVIEPSDTVVEVGAHIGYRTLHFASLVPQGRVVAFEPGSNNLPYLLHNCAGIPNIEVRREAVAASPGRARFFEDNLSGQNDSLSSLGASAAAANARSSSFDKLTVVPTQVDVVTLDEALGEERVQFVKVKIVGGEELVIEGAQGLLERCRPNLMVKVGELSRGPVWDLLVGGLGYRATTPGGLPIDGGAQAVMGNTHFMHPDGPVR